MQATLSRCKRKKLAVTYFNTNRKKKEEKQKSPLLQNKSYRIFNRFKQMESLFFTYKSYKV